MRDHSLQENMCTICDENCELCQRENCKNPTICRRTCQVCLLENPPAPSPPAPSPPAPSPPSALSPGDPASSDISQTVPERTGCTWDGSNNKCTGTYNDNMDCSEFETQVTCTTIQALPDKDGWIKSSASCYGHYDWIEYNDVPQAMGCEYNTGSDPIPQGDPQNCTEGVKTGLPYNYAQTTCSSSSFPSGSTITKQDLATGDVAAFNHVHWSSTTYNEECGKCVEVKCDPGRFPSGTQEQTCTGKDTIKLKIVDKMGETTLGANEDYLRNIDINDNAFVKLTGQKTCSASVPIMWRPASCGDKK